MPAIDWATLAAPKGWEWKPRPKHDPLWSTYQDGSLSMKKTTKPNFRELGEALTAMLKWAKEHNLYIRPFSAANEKDTKGRPIRFWNVVTVYAGNYTWEYTTADGYFFEHRECSCGNKTAPQYGICPECKVEFRCKCGSMENLSPLSESVGKGYGCSNCYGRCRAMDYSTGRYCNKAFDRENNPYNKCPECIDLRKCTGCGKEHEADSMLVIDKNEAYCQGARSKKKYYDVFSPSITTTASNTSTEKVPEGNCASGVCRRCWNFNPKEQATHHGIFQAVICSSCRDELDKRDAPADEELFDEEAEISPDELLLESDPLRPVRICGIELEAALGGPALAKELAKAGLAMSAEVQGHGTGYKTSHKYFCHVEEDSSTGATGGELVFNKLRLDDKGDVENLHKAIGIVRRMQKSKEIAMNMRCGLHIHVDAHQFGVTHARNLVLVFNYLEDLLYRLSAAHYVKHRGGGYSAKIKKGPYKDVKEFGLQFFPTNSHTQTLNLGNYWVAMNENCKCGAAKKGNHTECSCNLGKCTFEFRVFNSTSNFRKLLAYTALSHSIVSFARVMDDLDHEKFPVMEWTPVRKPTAEIIDMWMERLTWMFENLYFSEREREALLYTIENSDLAIIGADAIEKLRNTEYVAPEGAKPVPALLHAARENNIEGTSMGTYHNPFQNVPAYAGVFAAEEDNLTGDPNFDFDDDLDF